MPGGIDGSTDSSVGAPPSTLAASTMPFDSIPISLAGLRLATITIVRPDELLGLIGLGNAGHDGPLLRPDVHSQLQQLLRLRDGFGLEHLRDAKLHLHEVVDGEPFDPAPAPHRRQPAAQPAAGAAAGASLGGGVTVSAIARNSSRVFSIRGNKGSIAPSRVPARSVPAFSSVQRSCGTPSMRRMRSAASGITGSTSAPVTRKASAA